MHIDQNNYFVKDVSRNTESFIDRCYMAKILPIRRIIIYNHSFKPYLEILIVGILLLQNKCL